ncbi:MAG: M48 family metallopeptidase [Candidatus Eisenbacteria sp.]|nr:M48 family metallopeptidase [Candidatus Eisenbacteria bacterium]
MSVQLRSRSNGGPILGLLLITLLACTCSTVPLTGRRQLNLIPESQINSLSLQQYEEFLSAHELSRDREATAMVRRVGRNIQQAVEQFYRERGESEALNGYRWEFSLIEDDQVNAWCMPGGKVVVYTGLLPVAQDNAGLAVVVGHEVAHAIARHGNERMSHGLVAQLGGLALDKALENKPEETRGLFMAAYGIGAQVGVLLPYSRLHESEADHLGLIFMAMAGYDPRVAISFWERMVAQKQSAAPPEFLSTHPADETRIRNMRELMPEAMEYYRPGQ